MMNAWRPHRQPVCGLVAIVCLTFPALIASAAPAPGILRLSNTAVTLLYPEEWRTWAISLASYADVAARDITALLGINTPGGTIRWEPAASGPGAAADGVVEVHGDGNGAVVVVRTNVPLLTEDFGPAYALGYGRWLGAYAVARIAMGAPGGQAPWWTEGAALYLTDRLFRGASTTTPVLYGIEGNFVRAAQSRRPVDLATSPLSAAARGKALTTFKLLESVYGSDTVLKAIAALVSRPSTELASIVDAIGRDRQPDPDLVLRDWLEPTVVIDVALDRVDVRDNGTLVRARVRRDSPIPIPVVVEVRCVDGQVVTEVVPAGIGDAPIEIEIPSAPVSITLDPDGILPDTNRSNNRHGFGDAENVRQFFTFDLAFDVSELEFGGEIALDESQQRSEPYTFRVTNLTDRQTGLGLLLSAEWLDRPERIQRALFVPLGPRETRVVAGSLGYPNRGSGRARVEAKFWHAGSVEDLTDMLISREPGSTSNYLLVREAPEAPRRAQRGIYRVPPEITQTEGTLAQPPAPDRPAAGTTNTPAAPASLAEGPLSVEIRSPRPDTIPIGDVVIEAAVGGSTAPERVEFWVNDRRVGESAEAPYRVDWTFPDDERVFVVRAVAVAGEHVASDDLVIDRASVSFGSTVNLVTVHATVRDDQGRLVRDLGAEDVVVVEDGVEQEVVQIDFGEVPVSAALLLDQSSSMIGGGIRSERAGARRLIESLVNEVNRAMVMGFNDRVYVYTAFTTDKDRLNRALEAVTPDGSTSLFDTLAEAVRKVNRDRGKRALVVLSDGIDTGSKLAYEDVVEYLRQTDVLVYTIGLQLMADGTEYGDASGAVKRGVEQLRALAEATGGAAYFPLALAELEEIYGLIADELNSQYALSYYPRNTRFDGKWRTLQLRIPAHPGYVVHVRPGYYGVLPEGRR